MEILASAATIIFSGFVLIITIVSHHILHKYRKDTLGRKSYRWLLVLFSCCGFYFGFAPATYIFLFAAVISERLLVYRACRNNKDWLGRLLIKIDW